MPFSTKNITQQTSQRDMNIKSHQQEVIKEKF